MNNEEAMALLEAKLVAVKAAISELSRYSRESADWKTATAATRKGVVQTQATDAGVDLSTLA